MASIQKRPDGRWRARYRDDAGREHARHFTRKVDAARWLDEVTAAVVNGTYVDPKTARTTVGEWCDTWLAGYATRKPSTVRQAQVHLKLIRARFGDVRLSAVRPSDVKAWTVQLSKTLAPSTVYATYRRFAQVMGDAVHDGLLPRSPCSRRTSPAAPRQRPYVASTAQVWGLYDAMPEHLRPAVLLGAFAGLRVSEAVALRVEDVDFMRGVVAPSGQGKTAASDQPVAIPRDLALLLAGFVERSGAATVVTSDVGRASSTWAVERAVRSARGRVEGLPAGFRFHDLRHYFASLLIASGLDVKVVQAQLRHASATTTLNTYGHMFPDKDESARAAVASVLAARADYLRTNDAL